MVACQWDGTRQQLIWSFIPIFTSLEIREEPRVDALNSYDGAIGLLTPIEAYVHGNMKLLRTMCWSLVFGEY